MHSIFFSIFQHYVLVAVVFLLSSLTYHINITLHIFVFCHSLNSKVKCVFWFQIDLFCTILFVVIFQFFLFLFFLRLRRLIKWEKKKRNRSLEDWFYIVIVPIASNSAPTFFLTRVFACCSLWWLHFFTYRLCACVYACPLAGLKEWTSERVAKRLLYVIEDCHIVSVYRMSINKFLFEFDILIKTS